MGFFSRRIQKTCLNPHFSLRMQMFLSFGITAVIAISAFILVGLYTTVNSGQSVRTEARKVLTEGIRYSLGRSAQYVAETITKKFHNIGGAGSLMAKATADRFVGYPSMEGWEDDIYVPFLNIDTNNNTYPINAEPLPLDWDTIGNVDATNYEEHLPYRPLEWYFEGAGVSSIHGAYFMRGACDPAVTDPTHPHYYPECTRLNNNLRTGGVVEPTETNYHIANKAKDLVWLLKPLYESHLDVKTVGVFFANDGAGSTVRYPGSAYDGRGSYTSIGCEWMRQIHPLTNKSVGTPEQIARCHPAGAVVKMREYNPLERGWCQEQVERDIALHENRTSRAQMNTMATGPYLDAFNIENIWVMTFGQAVFDILTNEFIACTLVDVSIALLYDLLTQATEVGDTAQAALIRWDDVGTVVVASRWDPKTENTTAYVTDPDLQLGVDSATYQKIRTMVDYDSVWNPEDVLATYQNTVEQTATKLIMMHPVPNVPKEYNEWYRPEYFVIISKDKREAYGVLEEMDVLIEADTQASRENILMVGGIGFGVILFFIAVISGNLTKPLRWMQKVSGTVVDSCGGPDMGRGLLDDLDPDEAKPLFWGPRTEVTLLLSEFVKMIEGFSGGGGTEVAGAQVNEVKNDFEWRKMYAGLYPWGEPEDEPDNPGGIPKQLSILKDDTFDDELTTESTQHTAASILSLLSASLSNSVANSKVGPSVDIALSRTSTMLQSVKEYAIMAGAKAGILKEPEEEKIIGPPKVNLGENIKQPKDAMKDYFEGVDSASKSYLFWWTTFFIGAPIVVAAIMISVTVTKDASEDIPNWLNVVKETSLRIELDALVSAAKNRAAYGEEVMHRFARDLHVYTRLAGWLLFDGLARANSMTFQVSGNEECKMYDPSDNQTECPFVLNDTLTPCAMAWDDPWPDTEPKVYNNTHPRYLQHRWYNSPSSDANENGDRFSTTWPNIDYLPETTNWWNDTRTMPGSDKGDSASGYETTYDRLRVSSALSAADFPIYNYYPGKDEQRLLGSYVGWEADGTFNGASGCMYWEDAAWFVSDDISGAYKVNSTLCPKGKFGYDARCRGWYADSSSKVGRIHITSPYLFANSLLVGMSAGAALIDPRTGLQVGVSLIDFIPGAIFNAVDPKNTAIGQGSSGFPIVITPEPDALGFDTLVGPGLVDTASVTSLVLPHDNSSSTNWRKFNEDVLSRMQVGDKTYASFNRSKEDGSQEELYMAFAPVMLRSQVAVNHSIFSAGTISYYAPVFALGFGITLEDLDNRFEEVEEVVNSDIDRVSYISLALIIGAVLMVMYMTYTMTIYLAEPILCLVGIVQMISSKTITDELPTLEGGSREIRDVYDSLEKLCKIVRFSNAADFRGDRTKSYKVLEEALELFIDMENQKAMGVANNNLGTMVLQEQMEKSSETARSEKAYLAGMKYFDEAIRIGTFEYQNADFDDYRGDYVKQLANRYFNRGMFQIVNRHHKPAYNAEENGIKDLKRAKALDQEAFLYWRERDQLVAQARNEFFCTLRRARGMMTLVQVCEFEDVWGIEKTIEAANEMLHDPDYATSSTLFENVNMVARRQQVDDLRIQYALLKKDTLTAATLAMKILVEDEYVIDTVLMNCVTTLNTHFNLHGAPNEVPQLAKGVKRETRRGQVDSMREAKNVIFCLDYSGSMAGERMQRANSNLLWIYEEHCLDKDYVGFCRFNHAVDDKLYFGLARKGGNQEQHMDIIGKALDAEGGTRLYAALHRCVNMILENDNPRDSWIIALTDGESAWDFPAKQVISRIDKHNKKGGPKIHVVIIGFEVPSQVADSVATITSITDKSMYIDARGGLDEMDNAFEQVAAVITGTATTMETF